MTQTQSPKHVDYFWKLKVPSTGFIFSNSKSPVEGMFFQTQCPQHGDYFFQSQSPHLAYGLCFQTQSPQYRDYSLSKSPYNRIIFSNYNTGIIFQTWSPHHGDYFFKLKVPSIALILIQTQSPHNHFLNSDGWISYSITTLLKWTNLYEAQTEKWFCL